MAEIYRTSTFLPLARPCQTREPPPMQIQVLIYDGFDELDAIGPYEILHGAGMAPEYAVLAEGADEVGTITASHGTVIVPHATLAEKPDLLLVPGGGWRTREEVGTWG